MTIGSAVPRLLFQMEICMSYIVLIKETNIQSHGGVAVAQLGVMIEIGCAKEVGTYRVFFKYCVFSSKCCDFFNSASSAASLVFYLPGVCTHIDTEGKQRKARVGNIF